MLSYLGLAMSDARRARRLPQRAANRFARHASAFDYGHFGVCFPVAARAVASAPLPPPPTLGSRSARATPNSQRRPRNVLSATKGGAPGAGDSLDYYGPQAACASVRAVYTPRKLNRIGPTFCHRSVRTIETASPWPIFRAKSLLSRKPSITVRKPGVSDRFL